MDEFKEEIMRELASLDSKVDANQAYNDDRFTETERVNNVGCPFNLSFSVVKIAGLGVPRRRGPEDALATATLILNKHFNFFFPPSDVRRAWRYSRKLTSPILIR